MNHISTYIIGLLLTLGLALTGCDGLIYDYEGDCDYRVRFVFDRHLHYSDAFAQEVNAVTLYIIDDATGEIVWQKSESGPELKTGHYSMRIDRDFPDTGTYSMLAWCGEGKDEHFLVASHPHYTGLKCRMERDRDPVSGRAYVDHDLKRLYHGRLDEVVFRRDTTNREFTIELTKDVNDVNIMLQHLSGDPVNPEEFTVRLSDDNGHLDWDNTPLADESIEYRPHHVSTGTASAESKALTTQSVMLSEFTVSRLMDNHKLYVDIINSKGDTTVHIPVIDYALIMKTHHYAHMSDQEYLDRQDKYDMTFFLDEGGRWQYLELHVLSWNLVVYPPTDI